ncbi:MAG: hypothetical protein IPO07_06330 [Haliscomenobacter sp.]|nr:hypothetical protein [Haliscomenobacter sp.]MBK9488431.1 hypothetical protein [Haliscomenobacter sp.]
MSMTLSFMLMFCAEQYESIYLNAQEGELRVQLQNLHPAAIDSAIFRLTGTGPLVRNEMDGQELVLDLAKVAMGQHLTEVEVHSHMLEAHARQKPGTEATRHPEHLHPPAHARGGNCHSPAPGINTKPGPRRWRLITTNIPNAWKYKPCHSRPS